MDLGIEGETALIQASSRGIGYGCAEALVAAGARVVINGLDEARGRAAAERLGGDTCFIAANVAEPEGRARLHEAACEHLGHISILVTNVGQGEYGELPEFAASRWHGAFENTMLSALDLVTRCLPAMTARGFGRVVNIGSVLVKRPNAGTAPMAAMKSGLAAALVCAARDVADTGVTVNNIHAGAFETDTLREGARAVMRLYDLSKEEAYERYREAIPMGRFGTIQEVGDLCAFLCSRRAGYITGQGIVIDGGDVAALY